MYKRKLFIHTDNDWPSIKQVMEEQGIPYYSHQFMDSSSPVLEGTRNEIIISFPEMYSQAFFKAVDEDLQTEVFTEKESTPSFKAGKALLIMYSILMSVLFARYFYINYHSSSSKNFTYSWDHKVSEHTVQHKTLTGTRTVFVDKNYDLNFERVYSYIKNQKVSTFFDKDENGIHENYEEYDAAGKLSAISDDVNQDGNYETWLFYMENGNTLKLLDTNDNGRYDVLEEIEGKD